MLSVIELERDFEGLRLTQQAFLEAVIETGSVTDAADKIGISRRTPYGWLEREQLPEDGEAVQGTFTHALAQAKKAAGERAAGRVFQHSQTTPGMPGVIASIAYAKRYDKGWNDQLTVHSTSVSLSARVDLNQLDPGERAQLLELTHRRLLLAQQKENVAVGDDEAGEGGG